MFSQRSWFNQDADVAAPRVPRLLRRRIANAVGVRGDA
jgi:hypothetical protein